MSQLDDTSRDAYRRSLLAEALAERYPVVPWKETRQRPSPRPQRLVRDYYGAKVTARHRRDLNAALLDPIDASSVSAA